ncbi:plasmid stabilization protein [Marispirochaeta aestuarii]|uniref:Plasmid stabilization protein n=1 Tax=Marispirochaeta aestuarii TaxID=1963862 RepID=A0A1Y1S1L8_9SPIO|nr:plasmid stabilization protein [Marispirochaeta aestuarii]ORC37408.1 plasmid stabilization protein [Marispirochaeta aestuarii]
MASLTIRNLDKEIKSRLRVLAARHDRSMEEEARCILGEVLTREENEKENSGLGSRIHRRFSDTGGIELSIPERREPARAAEIIE